MATTQAKSIYQLKITLMESKPPIWRRLLVHSDIKMGLLHTAIQYSMGWQDCHLHQFERGGVYYGLEDDEFDMEVEDESRYRLSDLLQEEEDSLVYEYDFGDGWRHKVVLEKVVPFEASAKLVRCSGGRRACPPEDCGGIWGYVDLLEAIADTAHPEHEDMVDWLGEGFDPEYFSQKEVNAVLSGRLKKC